MFVVADVWRRVVAIQCNYICICICGSLIVTNCIFWEINYTYAGSLRPRSFIFWVVVGISIFRLGNNGLFKITSNQTQFANAGIS